MGGHPPVFCESPTLRPGPGGCPFTAPRGPKKVSPRRTRRARRSEFVPCGEATTVNDQGIVASPRNERILLRVLCVLCGDPALLWGKIGFGLGLDWLCQRLRALIYLIQ